MSIKPLQFTGVSSMSDNLQSILTRAVNIAKLPLTQLQNADTDLLSKKTLLSGLGDAASTLGDAVRKLGTVASTGSLTATSSASTKVSVQNTGAAAAASYEISEVTSIAAAPSARTGSFATSDTTKVSLTGKMDLVVGGKTYSLDLAKNSLTGLRDAINQSKSGVTASILTVGSLKYLSLSGDTTGAISGLGLIDDPSGTGTQMFANPDLGSPTTAASAVSADFADPATTAVSLTGHMRLTIASQTFDVTLTANSLNGVRDAINGLGAGVTASVVTDGNGSHVSVVNNTVGGVSAFGLVDDPDGARQDTLQNVQLGSDAQFKLNGISVQRSSNVVGDIIPGLTFTLLGKTGDGSVDQPVTLALSKDKNPLSAAVSSFVTAYNAMSDKVQAQVGKTAGLLTGDPVVRNIQDNLRALGGYSSDGVVKSLSDMGLTFDQSGKLSFDSSKFSSLSDAQLDGALKFFGAPATGFGGLAKKFDSLTDPITGVIRLEQNGFDASDRNLQSKITTLEDRIGTYQTDTLARLQAADSVIAQLESQKAILDASIQAINLSTYGKQK